jgi:hypothetical protein
MQTENTECQDPFSICGQFLKAKETVYIMGEKIRKDLDFSLQLAFDTVKTLESDLKLKDFDYSPIENGLNILKSLTFHQEYSQELITFIKAYIYIAYNVNENTLKHNIIKEKIAYLQRYCDNALTYSEYLEMMKIVTDKLMRYKEWSPPPFRLSAHYYNILKEE